MSQNTQGYNGLLLVDKPARWTSFDVVNYIRKIIAVAEEKKPKHVKVGHTGTLDPLATGLMVVVVGEYCKRAQEFSKLDKTYEVTARLGQTSSTGDEEGEKTAVSDFKPDHENLRFVIGQFIGEIEQVPPAYSAIKVDGVRAYKLAREGKDVDIPPRKVNIYSINHVTYEYPEVTFTADVSSGTYIRTLVEDIGQALKTGAYMSGLRRSAVGEFKLTDALEIQGLTAGRIRERLQLI